MFIDDFLEWRRLCCNLQPSRRTTHWTYGSRTRNHHLCRYQSRWSCNWKVGGRCCWAL